MGLDPTQYPDCGDVFSLPSTAVNRIRFAASGRPDAQGAAGVSTRRRVSGDGPSAHRVRGAPSRCR